MQGQSEGKSRRDRPIGAASLSSNDHFSLVPESGKLIALVPQMSTAPISSSAPQPLRSGPFFIMNRGHSVRAKAGRQHESCRIVAIRSPTPTPAATDPRSAQKIGPAGCRAKVREELRHRSNRNLPESATTNKLRALAFPKNRPRSQIADTAGRPTLRRMVAHIKKSIPWRPVSGEPPSRRWTRPTVDGRRRLARVRNRSKFRRAGHEARWLSLTLTGPGPRRRAAIIRLTTLALRPTRSPRRQAQAR